MPQLRHTITPLLLYFLRTQDPEVASDSLLYLASCNEAAIIDALQRRFMRTLYFTRCDNLLIFVNPTDTRKAAMDSIFSVNKAAQYWTGRISELPIHPYLIARRAFYSAREQHRNQLVLTFGPFNSGQRRVHHELVKFFVRFAATLEEGEVTLHGTPLHRLCKGMRQLDKTCCVCV